MESFFVLNFLIFHVFCFVFGFVFSFPGFLKNKPLEEEGYVSIPESFFLS